MATFSIPTKDQVTTANQAIFDQLEEKVGFVPNLYAYYAKGDSALGDYLTFQNRESSLKGKEKELVNLVTSQYSDCRYCLSAHTAMGKMNGFSDEQILEIRQGRASFDSKLDALAKLTLNILEHGGKADAHVVDEFFTAGYSEKNLVDLNIAIGTKIISNFIHNLTDLPVDFPEAPALQKETA